MPISLPQFNLFANVWRPPNAPPAPPDNVYAAQLYFMPRGPVPITPGNNDVYAPPVYIRFPRGVDVLVDDMIECADGDGWFYTVRFIERVHRGFPNEYFVAVCESLSGGSAGFGILMESTGYVLMEDGTSHILME